MKHKCTAIVLAAGQGKRMNSNIQKQFLEIKGFPIIYYSLKCFQESEIINDIVLVTGKDFIEYCEENIVKKYNFDKVSKIVAGGKERYDSVYEGLKSCKDTKYVFIHDGARPFISEEIILKGYEKVKKTKACVVAMPSKDTIKIGDSENKVVDTPERKNVWIVQTPQIFDFSLVKKAYDSLYTKDMTGITDDAMVVEKETGVNVYFSEGSYQNIKITTPEDIAVAEAFLALRQENHIIK